MACYTLWQHLIGMYPWYIVHGYECRCLFTLLHFCTDVASSPGSSGGRCLGTRLTLMTTETFRWKVSKSCFSTLSWQCMAMVRIRIYKPIYMCLRWEGPGDEASPVVKLTLTRMSSSVSLGKSSSSESASSSNKEPTISLAKPEMSEVDYRKSR